MKFGLTIRRGLCGATLAVYILELSAMLPVLYILAVPGYPAVVTGRNLLSFACELGLGLMPRVGFWALSLLYRRTLSETAVCFTLLISALIFGVLADNVLRYGAARGRRLRIVFCALVAADLLVRLLPLSFNRALSAAPSIAAAFVLCICFVLILLDLLADRKSNSPAS